MSDDLRQRLEDCETAETLLEAVAMVMKEAYARIDELEAERDAAVAGLTEAARQFRVIAGMDLMGASSVAYSAARDAERIRAMVEEQTNG